MIKIGCVGECTSYKLKRCICCEYLTEEGNCLAVGGYYSSVDDKYCPKINGSCTVNIKGVPK